MTDGASPQTSANDSLAASLARLERALGRIAHAQASTQVVPTSELSTNLAARLDGLIAQLRAVVDNGEEGTSWPR